MLQGNKYFCAFSVQEIFIDKYQQILWITLLFGASLVFSGNLYWGYWLWGLVERRGAIPK